MNQHTTIQQLEGLLAYHDAGYGDWPRDVFDPAEELRRAASHLRFIAAVCRLKNVSLLAVAKSAVDAAETDRLRRFPTQTPSPPAAP
jgi:hypothetical protein